MRSLPSGRADAGWLTERPYAHRGLHGPGVPENSLSAFEAAIRERQGIELDVRLSRNDEAIVFHDDRLERLTGASGPVKGLSAPELARIALTGSRDTIPPLAIALERIAARAPLLVEIKASRREAAQLSAAVLRCLGDYRGPAAIMSFNPAVGHWFARHAPRIPRGLVVSEERKRNLRGQLERTLSFWRARPHFLAYDVRDLPSGFAARQRAKGMPILTWTVRNARHHEVAAVYADQIIHERPPTA